MMLRQRRAAVRWEREMQHRDASARGLSPPSWPARWRLVQCAAAVTAERMERDERELTASRSTHGQGHSHERLNRAERVRVAISAICCEDRGELCGRVAVSFAAPPCSAFVSGIPGCSLVGPAADGLWRGHIA